MRSSNKDHPPLNPPPGSRAEGAEVETARTEPGAIVREGHRPWPAGLTEEIRRLLPSTAPPPGIAPVDDALPASWDLFSYVFLGATGIITKYDTLDDTRSTQCDGRLALQVLAVASRRYPSLAPFVPSPQDDAAMCAMCDGSGTFTDRGCPRCGGLGRSF